jgi:hypothetical protein
MTYKTYNAAGMRHRAIGNKLLRHQSQPGAFVAQNSSKDLFSIGLLVGAFDAGGGGISRARAASGF